jgi:hypothetical protein
MGALTTSRWPAAARGKGAFRDLRILKSVPFSVPSAKKMAALAKASEAKTRCWSATSALNRIITLSREVIRNETWQVCGTEGRGFESR